MTLWTLEWLRLWRTKRWIILAAVYGFFGILGPLTVRFLPDILERVGGEDFTGGLPPLTPPDGMTQYIGNAQQIGLLAVAFVAAAALAFDSKIEMAVFLRTRATVREIFTPRFVVNAAAAAAAFAFGAGIAYVGTGLLLEWLDLGAVLVGTALQCLYLVFAVAVIGFLASILRSVPGVALLAVGVLIVIALLALIPGVAPWLPSELLGALDALVRGGSFDYWRAIAITVVVTAGLVVLAINRLEEREI